VATASEHVVSSGRTIDISLVGVLACFPGAALPVTVGDRCLVSLDLGDGALHLRAWVRRRERGADDLHYVGFEYDDPTDADRDRLRRSAGLERSPSPRIVSSL
jgi:hypothetical protein